MANGKRKNNKNNKSYSKRNYNSRNNDEVYEAREKRAKTNNCNDVNWYVPTDQSVKDVASFSLNNVMGTNYHLNGDYGVSSISSTPAVTSAPGIMTLFATTIPGCGTTVTSPINLAATDLYNEIRRANSGTKVYDAPDCMQLLISLASVYATVSWAQRLYGMANVYSSSNAYMPRALVESAGVDFESLRNNMNAYRTKLNNLVLQANTFNVPTNIPIFQRWYFLFEKIYADSQTNRAQLYQFSPEGYYIYDDTMTTLEFHRMPFRESGSPMDAMEVLNIIEDMLAKLTYSEDARTISADIEKAFGARLLNLSQIAENYSVVPDYSDEMRGQIMNARIFDVTNINGGILASIAQDPTTNALMSQCTIHCSVSSPGNLGSVWLNSHSMDISPEEIMTSTRLMPTPYREVPFSTNIEMDGWSDVYAWALSFDECCGSEIITGATITYGYQNASGFKMRSATISSARANDGSSLGLESFAYTALLLSAFDWAPQLRWYLRTTWNKDWTAYTDSTEMLEYIGTLQEIDNGIMLTPNNLRLLHQTALLGEFGIPKIRA